MQKIILFLAIFLQSFLSFSQDILTKKGGEKLSVKVEEIGETDIRYKRWDNLKGPTYVIAKAFVASIVYENGKKDDFSDPPSVSHTRNVLAVGYQIGGFSLIGFEYEFRILNYLGIDIGCGFKGATAGVKLHFRPDKNSPFLLFSYKDGGIGLINTVGTELGGRWVFNKKRDDFGLLFQVGFARILYIDRNFEKLLANGGSVSPFTLSMGIGLSW